MKKNIDNIISKVIKESVNKIIKEQSNGEGFKLVHGYISELFDYCMHFEDKNGWEEDIRNTFGDEFFEEFDEEWTDAVQNALVGIEQNYKAKMNNM